MEKSTEDHLVKHVHNSLKTSNFDSEIMHTKLATMDPLWVLEGVTFVS